MSHCLVASVAARNSGRARPRSGRVWLDLFDRRTPGGGELNPVNAAMLADEGVISEERVKGAAPRSAGRLEATPSDTWLDRGDRVPALRRPCGSGCGTGEAHMRLLA